MKRSPLKRGDGSARARVAVPKPCKVCRQPFVPRTTLHVVCPSITCALVHVERVRAKAEAKRQAAERKADKAKLEAMEPISYWEKLAERQVNRYVRLRDAHLGCISCDKPASWPGQWHASHFRSVGAASAVRYHLWNIHKSCSECNRHKSGNLSEYEPRLRARHGDERVDWLRTQNQIVRRSREYLERLKEVFSKKANRLAKRLEKA